MYVSFPRSLLAVLSSLLPRPLRKKEKISARLRDAGLRRIAVDDSLKISALNEISASHLSPRYPPLFLPFQVSKSCASSEECGPASVGCIPVDTQQVRNSEFCRVTRTRSDDRQRRNAKQEREREREGETGEMKRSVREGRPAELGEINSVISFQICISCCDLNYCNIESPTNATNAIYSRKRRIKSKPKRKRPGRNGVDAGTRLYGPGLLWLSASLFYAYHC